MTKRSWWLVLWMGLVALTALGAPEARAQYGGHLEVYTLFNGNPTQGYTVTVPALGYQSTTDYRGRVRLMYIPAGTYVVSASRPGYVTQQQTTVVSDGVTQAVVFRLEPQRGRVAGVVQLLGATTHEGVRIALSGTSLSATTGANGLFDLGAVPVGTRVLSAQKAGYVTAQATVTVREGETLSSSLSLEKAIGRIAGRLSLSDLSTHEGIAVSLEGTAWSTTTTAAGDFNFEGVPAGTYALLARKGRYATLRQNVEVKHAQTSSVTSTLQKLPPPAFPPFMLAVQGGRLTLRGSELGALQGASQVWVGPQSSAQVLHWSDTQIVVQLPDTLPRGETDVVVSIEGWGVSAFRLRVLPQVTLAGGNSFSVAILADGSVATAGAVSTVPAGLTDVVSVAASSRSGLALKRDGSVVSWRDAGQDGVPALTDAVLLTGGMGHFLALKQDGTLVGWGDGYRGTPPEKYTEVVDVAAGLLHTVVLKRDGTVKAWGYNLSGESSVPAGLTGVVDVAADAYFSLALKQDGTLVGWGQNDHGQLSFPPGLSGVVSMAASASSVVVLKQDGTVVSWGDAGPAPAGLSDVVAVAAETYGLLALKRDGSVVSWGYAQNLSGWQLKVPAP